MQYINGRGQITWFVSYLVFPSRDKIPVPAPRSRATTEDRPLAWPLPHIVLTTAFNGLLSSLNTFLIIGLLALTVKSSGQPAAGKIFTYLKNSLE